MDEDSGTVKATRIAAVVLGVMIVILGIVILEGGLLDSVLPAWGWLFNAAVGGGTVGLGLGLGAAGVTGENRVLDRLRARADSRRKLTDGERRLTDGEWSDGADSDGKWSDGE